MNQSGIPTIDNAAGAFESADVQNQITASETPEISIADVVDTFLAETEGDAIIIIDPKRRKVFCETGTTYLLALAGSVGTGKNSTIVPDSGQEGRSLTWTATPESGFDADMTTGIATVVAAARPARTVNSLVASLLNAVGEVEIPEGDEEHVPFVCINQEAGTVQLKSCTNRATARAALMSFQSSVTEGVSVALTEPSDAETEPLIFEGGPTS